MLIENVTIVSKNVKMNKIYPISSGLIFTANEISWFEIARLKFGKFTKAQYMEWLKGKSPGDGVGYWEPVGFF